LQRHTLQVREDAKDIKVGTVIALMVAEGEDWKSVEVPKTSDASSLAPSPSPSEPASKPGSGGNGDTSFLLEHEMGSS
jgi:pyruvate/2-oxoglutarate dehydrogenase complex dihydrolipoamide acyltransferase (E2) component